MFSRVGTSEKRFFELFNEIADLIVEAVLEFQKMVNDLSDAEAHSKTIKDLEHRADKTTHQTIELLHKTFITPLDREDIHKLITELDDILDFIEAASQRIFLYDIKQLTPEARDLAEVCSQSASCVQKAVHGLSNLKNVDLIRQNCIEINRLENEADNILRSGMAKLFREEPDTRQLIKMKEIYELLETVTDRCEDVANVIDGIVLEYA
jgi:predicted phosphate transport protein (TIGR00153 family)